MNTNDSTTSTAAIGYHRSGLLDPSGKKTVTFPVDTLSPEGDDTVTECHNLRPSPYGGLEGVPHPVVMLPDLLPGATFVPGGTFCHKSGEVSMLLQLDGKLYVSDGASYTAVTTISSTALSAVATDDGWTVMTSGSSLTLSFGETGWTVSTPVLDLPPLTFERLDGTLFSDTTTPLTSTTPYSTSVPSLRCEDNEKITSFLSKAYIRMASQALTARQFIQPVIASYRLIGPDNKVVYTSAPVLISPADGVQATEVEIPVTGDSAISFGRGTISAMGFTIGLRLTADPGPEWTGTVRSVEILVSPQFHPLSSKETCINRIVWGSDGSSVVKCCLPGVSDRLKPGARGGYMWGRVSAVMSRIDTALKPVASAPVPTTAGDLIRINPYDDAIYAVERELSMMRTLINSASPVLKAGTKVMDNISAPHSFFAAAGARSGNSILWGGITALPFPGYSLGELSICSDPLAGGAVPAAVRVEMADGTSVVRESVIQALRPTALSPLLAYPSAEARSVTIVTRGNSTTFDLTPAPGGRWSYYLDPDMKPIGLGISDSGDFAVPVADPPLRTWPGAVVLASSSSPLAALHAGFSDAGEVKAVAPAVNTGSSLDMSRTKFYAFGPAGCSRVTCSPTLVAGINLLSRAGADRAGSVVETGSGVAAIIGGTPVLIESGRMRVLRKGLTGDFLGWNAPLRELWVYTSGSGRATVINLDSGACYTRDTLDAVSSLSTPDGLRMITSSGRLLDAADKEVDETLIHFSYRSRIPSRCVPGSTYTLGINLFGRAAGMNLRLIPDQGDADPSAAPLIEINHSGGLSHRLIPVFRAVHAHNLTLEVDGTAQPSKIRMK